MCSKTQQKSPFPTNGFCCLSSHVSMNLNYLLSNFLFFVLTDWKKCPKKVVLSIIIYLRFLPFPPQFVLTFKMDAILKSLVGPSLIFL